MRGFFFKAQGLFAIFVWVFICLLSFRIDHAWSSGDTGSPFNPIETQEYLREFHKNPQKVMNTPLAKRDSQGNIVPFGISPFDVQTASRLEMLSARDATRDQICRAAGLRCDQDSFSKRRWAGFDDANQINRFLYEQDVVRDLLSMEREGLLNGALAEPPWTDSFWPMNRGLTARRWNDKNFPDSTDWQQNYDYFLQDSGWFFATWHLSPAEKYDLLVGDSAKTLTNVGWNAGKYHYDRRGHVPGWQGLCHGWAPASIMTPNPKKSVTVLGANGLPITFYPSDIKALASQAWGEATPRINFVGVRCKVNDPKEDEFGRVIDPACFDVNPGTWHMAVVNQVGRQKRGFIFDATYDFQVWNYPIYAYRYHYFNPQTLSTSDTLAGSMVRRSDFKIDKFKSYRSQRAAFIVGIAMDVQYAVPTAPSAKPVFNSLFHTVKYVYDLEIDQNGNVVGGEWYSNFHPDFIWNVPVGSKALSGVERQMTNEMHWDGWGLLPQEIRDAAAKASLKQQPLHLIVETLLRLSQ
jgi:hypothetical protein